MSELTWTCHVCGDRRPDDKVSVHSRKGVMGPDGRMYPLGTSGVELTENVRYCNDRPACSEGARTYSHFKGEA